AMLGLPDTDDTALLIHPAGSRVTAAQGPLHLRRARLTRLGMETNGSMCKSFLKSRYGETAGTG
ncbi:MAG: metal-sulfur cluster biosynthetic enzyme, partial [Actinomycetia bacterium]|nr:metal-sulfur cluster biosynthetic enzyme [Actinomycetes bacterium]